MKKVRKGIFETNSSSTHAICVAVEENINLPKSIHFGIGEYGWEVDTVYDTADYLYTGLLACRRGEDIEKIKQWLEEDGVKATFEEPVYRVWKSNDGVEHKYLDRGYVDHAYELREFLDAVTNDKHHCYEFLFSKGSFVNTGNDNDDYGVDINVNYPYKEYYKGN